jgi:hypothetical protein
MGADLLEPDPATSPAQDEGRYHEVIHRARIGMKSGIRSIGLTR